MAEVLESFEFGDDKDKLSIPHLRILKYLVELNGATTRVRIAEGIQISPAYVGRYVGFSKEQARKEFLQSRLGQQTGPSLIDRGYAVEIMIDVDGKSEKCIEVTDLGKNEYEKSKKRLESYDKRKQDKLSNS